MKKDISRCIARLMECQRVISKHRHSIGLLYPFLIPKWKWEVVTIDFITKLPKTIGKHDSIMVVVDNLIEVAHFIPI